MSRHNELSAATGVKVYFCDPHSPWQGGTCENTNGCCASTLRLGPESAEGKPFTAASLVPDLLT